MKQKLLTYVNYIDDDEICILSNNGEVIEQLRNLGFSKKLSKKVKSKGELIKNIKLIIDMKIPFASDYKSPAPDWYLNKYRSEGFFSGKYRLISWVSPDKCRIDEVEEDGNKNFIDEFPFERSVFDSFTESGGLTVLENFLKKIFK